jgi:hypothetical protein
MEDCWLLDEPNFAILATIAKANTLRNTIIRVDFEGDDIWLNGYKSRAWLANWRRNPLVAMAIFNLKNPYAK